MKSGSASGSKDGGYLWEGEGGPFWAVTPREMQNQRGPTFRGVQQARPVAKTSPGLSWAPTDGVSTNSSLKGILREDGSSSPRISRGLTPRASTSPRSHAFPQTSMGAAT